MKYTHQIEGRVEAVLVCDVANSIESSRKASIRLHLAGVVGDCHYGATCASNSRYPDYPRGTEIRNSRQVSIISVEEMQQVAATLALPVIQPEWLGANLLIRSIPALTHLPPSTRLSFPGGAVLIVQGENDPCLHPGRVIQANYPDRPDLDSAFVKAALHKRGIVAWVEHPGVVSEGEVMTATIPEQLLYTQFLG